MIAHPEDARPREEMAYAELLRRAQNGDTGAFEEILIRYERLVFHVAYRLLGNPDDAEDAAQEVFLRLYRRIDRIDPHRPLRYWLYRVTARVCATLYRRRQSTVASSPLYPMSDPDPHTLPDHVAERAELHRLIYAGLDTLPPQERTAIILRDLEELSTGEVAEILGIAETTVRSHIARARLKLKHFILARLRRPS